MKRSLSQLAIGMAAAFALGFAAPAARADDPPDEKLPAQELTARTLYQFLLAEIAGARGQIGLSTQLYLELARSTRDPRIARRATEIALFSRDIDAATQAAQLWAELSPESDEARRILAGVTAGRDNRLDDIQIQLARALAQHPENLTQNLLGLNRALGRIQDKQITRQLVQRLTEPYLDYPEAHFARAQAAIIADNALEALAAIDGALAVQADWEPAIVFKAQLLQQGGATQEAVKFLAQQLERRPDSRNLRLTYARALVSARQFEAARAEFGRLLAASPDDRDLIYANALLAQQLEDDAGAEQLFSRALEAGHPEADAIRLGLGQLADKHGDGARARNWYEQVGTGRHYAEAQLRLAQSLARDGKLDEARKILSADAGDDDANRRFVLAEAQLLRDANRSEEALQVIDQALRAAPDDTDLLYESAMLAERLDRMEVMEGRLRKLIALAPDHAHAYNALGYSLADRGQRLDEAEQLIGRALEISPDDPFILDSMGWVRFRQGRADDAATHLQRAYGIRPDPEIAAHLGEVLWVLGRRGDADRVFDEALTAHPENTVLRDTVARVRKP